MFAGLKNALICLLLLAASPVPLPWSHCHESLTPEQLVTHLKNFHPGCPPSDLPTDWHVHFSTLDFVDPEMGSSVARLFSPHEFYRSVQKECLSLGCVDLPIFEKSRCVRCNFGSRQDSPSHSCMHLFKQFGAFLI